MRKKDSVTKPTVHLNVNIPESALKIWHIEQIEQYELMQGVNAGTHIQTEITYLGRIYGATSLYMMI